jgi:hypothetical protein
VERRRSVTEPEPDIEDIEDIEVPEVPEPDVPEEGIVDPDDTHAEGVDADGR